MPVSLIQPVSFGAPQRRMIGIFHPATADTEGEKKPAVVLCKPYGQEAIRAHRMVHVLADRLSRNGHPVFRFDYFGTGDAMGDDIDGSLTGWCGDVRCADRELRRLSGASETTWIGMRLGASVALMAAREAPPNLAKLVLWDPIFDGPGYLNFLRARHAASVKVAYSLPNNPALLALARNPETFCNEAIGFAMSATLREQIGRLDPQTLAWPAQPPSIVVLNDPEATENGAVKEACAPVAGRVQLIELQHGIDWTTDTAGDSALVPPQAMNHLLAHAGAPA